MVGIKRKIMVVKVQGVTYSKMSSEFVIHIPEEYDYRYSSYDKHKKSVDFIYIFFFFRRDLILEAMLKAYCNATKGQLLPFFYIVY